jgi:predicted ATP-binding protein involved in virulence
MRLESLRLQNYRGFEDATLPLDRPLTVLFGENGSGKSSVLTALVLCFSELLRSILHAEQKAFQWRPTYDDIRLGTAECLIGLELRQKARTLAGRFSYKRGYVSLAGGFNNLLPNFLQEKPFLAIYYSSGRPVKGSSDIFGNALSATELQLDMEWALTDALNPGAFGFRTLFLWFKEREDAENRRKVQEKNFAATDPQLAAVRFAIEGLLPGYTNPRIQHDPLRLEITKGDQALSMDQLSDGEKQVLVMTADIARRLSMVYPKEPKPLEQEAVILVDEIELHLHPSWQRQILPAWRRVFPNCQFIVTTHSPQVISEVPNDAVYVIKNFQFYRPSAPTEGRDSNSILEEVMGTPERPQDVKEELEKIASLIDNERYADAHERLDLIAQRLTESDNEIVRLRVLLHFMEGSHAADSQK